MFCQNNEQFTGQSLEWILYLKKDANKLLINVLIYNVIETKKNTVYVNKITSLF